MRFSCSGNGPTCGYAMQADKISLRPLLGNGPNTVSESTVSNTELSEFFGAH